MITVFRAPVVCVGLGLGAWDGYKALKYSNLRKQENILIFWVSLALFFICEAVLDFTCSWIPFYYTAKLVYLLMLVVSTRNGVGKNAFLSVAYRQFQLLEEKTAIVAQLLMPYVSNTLSQVACVASTTVTTGTLTWIDNEQLDRRIKDVNDELGQLRAEQLRRLRLLTGATTTTATTSRYSRYDDDDDADNDDSYYHHRRHYYDVATSPPRRI